MITKLKYTNEDDNWVTITFEDGSLGSSSLTDGIRRQHTDAVQEYLDAGGIVEPYKTEEELEADARAVKREEAQAYLNATDFKFNTDYDEVVPDEIKQKRRAARQLLRKGV